MLSQKQLLTIFLLVCVSLSGCQIIDQQEPTMRGGSDNSPRSELIFYQDPSVNRTNFSYDGPIRFAFTYDREHEFEDVVVCLYDGNGVVLNSTTITLEVPSDIKNISIASSELPEYVVVDHPAFHQYPKEPTAFMIHQGEGRYFYDRNREFNQSQDAFPYPRHNETGRCM